AHRRRHHHPSGPAARLSCGRGVLRRGRRRRLTHRAIVAVPFPPSPSRVILRSGEASTLDLAPAAAVTDRAEVSLRQRLLASPLVLVTAPALPGVAKEQIIRPPLRPLRIEA